MVRGWGWGRKTTEVGEDVWDLDISRWNGVKSTLKVIFLKR